MQPTRRSVLLWILRRWSCIRRRKTQCRSTLWYLGCPATRRPWSCCRKHHNLSAWLCIRVCSVCSIGKSGVIWICRQGSRQQWKVRLCHSHLCCARQPCRYSRPRQQHQQLQQQHLQQQQQQQAQQQQQFKRPHARRLSQVMWWCQLCPVIRRYSAAPTRPSTRKRNRNRKTARWKTMSSGKCHRGICVEATLTHCISWIANPINWALWYFSPFILHACCCN